MYAFGLGRFPYDDMEPPYEEPEVKGRCCRCDTPLYAGDQKWVVESKDYCEDCIISMQTEVI